MLQTTRGAVSGRLFNLGNPSTRCCHFGETYSFRPCPVLSVWFVCLFLQYYELLSDFWSSILFWVILMLLWDMWTIKCLIIVMFNSVCCYFLSALGARPNNLLWQPVVVAKKGLPWYVNMLLSRVQELKAVMMRHWIQVKTRRWAVGSRSRSGKESAYPR